MSLKLFFDDASGKQLGSEEQKKKIDESAYWLKITDCAVPKGTASIRYYVSNWGSLAGRPFIGGMSCTLTDKTKPAVQKITLDKSGLGDAAGNVALAGDTLRYYLEFDEKVSVSSYGTAKLALDGAATGISGTGSLVTENGKSKICYTFPLPETGKSGLLSLASVTGLSVKDEAGNVCTCDNSAVSSDSVQYYKQMTVSSQLEHLLLSGGANATYGQDYTATLRANKRYNLPGSVTVKVGASPLATAGYTYDSTTGRITIRGAYIKGDVEITAAGVAKKSTLTFDMQGGSGGTLSATGTYDNPLPMITVPGLTGYTFRGYYTRPDGQGTKYYDEYGVSMKYCDFDTATTLYAVWQRTVTVITFLTEDGTEYNAPLSVAYGEMLSSDGLMRPVRRGYLFAGYRTERDGLGELIFDADLHAVSSGAWDKNVSDLTLYACWIPVSYTVVYINGQKEAGRQSAVYGRPFDLLGAGPLGIIAPVGYHFAGWSTVPAGQTAVYADGQTIAEALTTADGDTVFLYAAFAPDQRFSVIYHPNGGSNAPVDPDKYFAGDSVPFGSAIPTRDGYIFAGWSYGTDGSVDFPYRDGRFTPASVTMQDGGLTLYAVWILNGKTLQEQIDEISGTNASLAGAINDLKNADTGFSGELSALKEQMQAAQDLLDSLGDTYVTKTELAGKVTELKNLLTQAQTDLTGKINQVQANLEAAVKELNETIKGNQEGVEARLDALEQARADADILLAKLQAEGSALGEKLTALEKTRKETDDKLLAMINGVKADLEAAVNRLNETIADNKDDMESRLADAERASANADALLRSDLTALAESNAALEERIAALENAVDTAHKTIWAGIERVHDDLDATRRRLEKSDRNLEKMIYDLQAESEKNAIACTVAVIMAVVTLIVTVGVAIYAAGKNRRDYR